MELQKVEEFLKEENGEKILDKEKIKQSNLSNEEIMELIKEAQKVTRKEIMDLGFYAEDLFQILKKIEDYDKYIDREMYEALRYDGAVILIAASRNFKDYLEPQKIKELNLSIDDIGVLIQMIDPSEEDRRWLLELKDELGLSDEQYKRISNPKTDKDGLIELKSYLREGAEVKNQLKITDIRSDIVEACEDGHPKMLMEIESAIINGKQEESNYNKQFLTNEGIDQLKLTELDVTILLSYYGIEWKDDKEEMKAQALEKGLDPDVVMSAVNPGKYLTDPTTIRNSNLRSEEIINMLKASRQELTADIIKVGHLQSSDIKEILSTTKQEITADIINTGHLNSSDAAEILKEILKERNQELTLDMIRKYNLQSYDIKKILSTTKQELTTDIIKAGHLHASDIKEILSTTKQELTGNIIEAAQVEHYNIKEILSTTNQKLTADIIKTAQLMDYEVVDILKETKQNLTEDIIEAAQLNCYVVVNILLVQKGQKLTEEMMVAGNFNRKNVTQMLKIILKERNQELTGDIIGKYNLDGSDVVEILNLPELISGVIDKELISGVIDKEIQNGTFSIKKVLEILEIIKSLDESNSAKLQRIKTDIAIQLYNLDEQDRDDVIKEIKNIFEENSLPSFAQNYLVFKYMHPRFLENNNLGKDSSDLSDIPSLNSMTPQQRGKTIFCDLLKIDMESSSRNLISYLDTMEQGNILIQNVLNKGSDRTDQLPKEQIETLGEYCKILNSIYNSFKGEAKRGKKRKNNENLLQDIQELCKLFKVDKYGGIEKLPDRIIRAVASPIGITTLKQARETIETISKNANEKNRTERILLKKGDLVKGIRKTKYIPEMLQHGIVAKDFLGADASYDCTPGDMDCELVTEEGYDFQETFQNLKTAPSYTCNDKNGRRLGTIILVFEPDENFEKTRDSRIVNDEAVKKVGAKKKTIEYFDNNGVGGTNAHGVRTGLGSSRIKCIITNDYLDKLGLEIAMNGFYIPIVDKTGTIIYTPEMYDDIRSKMQGLTHYGLTDFKLDETAKNKGTTQIISWIEKSKEEASKKHEKIMQTLSEAIKSEGLNPKEERVLNNISGIVEIIDTGSTGRGTNEPGDGDFDFMVRADKKVMDNPTELKEKIKEVLSKVSKPKDDTITASGDFRYKGVTIDGLDEPVDIDLTFARRNDEIEYTTDECIKDRLKTIRKNSQEDYEYVIANILLAKNSLKSAGVYKKKNAASPEARKKRH